MLHVVWVHGTNLVPSRRAQDFDDFNQLIDACLAREHWLTKYKLGDDTACGPQIWIELAFRRDLSSARLTNLRGVIRSAKDELGSTVVAGAYIRHIGLVLHQNLGTTEIAQLQDARRRIKQQVLGLDIAMTYTLRVNVGESTEKLIAVELDLYRRHDGLQLVEVA